MMIVNRSRQCAVGWVLTVVVMMQAAPHVSAAPPELQSIAPRGGQRGQTVRVTLAGRYLRPDSEVISTIPGRVELAPRAEDAGDLRTSLPLQIHLDESTPVGVYPIRIRTEDGLSNVLRFAVSGLPETTEVDPNESPAEAQEVALPVLVNGTLTEADQDHYRFTAEAGDRLVFEVEARRIGSQVDPAMRLLDEAGRELASNDDVVGLDGDARMQIVLPRSGTFVLIVHDATFAERSPSFYRLKMGAFAFADAIFPLGWTRGGAVNVSLVGGTFGDDDHVESLILPAAGRWAPVGLNGDSVQGALPFRFVLSNARERIEPSRPEARRLEPNTVVNGRLRQPREIDRYRMAVRPGQRWTFDLDAAALSSSALDGLLFVYDAADKQLAMSDDAGGLDPRIDFDVPDGVEEIVVAVEDLHRRGGPTFGYRLSVRPRGPGVSLRVDDAFVNIARGDRTLLKVVADRTGYDGPIQLTIPSDMPSIRAEGGTIEKGQNEGFLLLSADGDAPLGGFELPIVGLGGPDAQPFRCRVSGPYESDFPTADGIPAAICRSKPVQVTAGDRVRVVQSFESTLKLSAKRAEGADAEIEIKSANLPNGVGGGTTKIAENTGEAVMEFEASETAQLGSRPLLLTASTTVDNEPVTQIVGPLTIDVVRPFSVEIVSPPAQVKPGAATRMVGLVRREPPFEGTVTLQVPDLPAGVTAETVTVEPDTAVFELALTTTDEAAAGDVKVVIKASTQMGGRKQTKDYELPDIETKLVIAAPESTKADAAPQRVSMDPPHRRPACVTMTASRRNALFTAAHSS